VVHSDRQDSGLIVRLGEWRLMESVPQCGDVANDLKIAVNLPPVQFTAPTVRGDRADVAETGLGRTPASSKITERIFMENTENTLATCAGCKGLGVRHRARRFSARLFLA